MVYEPEVVTTQEATTENIIVENEQAAPQTAEAPATIAAAVPLVEEVIVSDEFGVFSGTKAAVNEDGTVVTCVIDSTLPGKNKLTLEMESPLVGFLLLKEISRHLSGKADALAKARGME